MNLLEWKAEYSVGIQSMDDEHREMIGLINKFYTELGGRRDPDAIEQFLGEIHSTIAGHFALEERIMRDSGYGEYLEHKDDHEELLDQIGDMMDAFYADAATGFVVLEERLSAWFGEHFNSFDARLHGKLNH
jgi:hemerythrin